MPIIQIKERKSINQLDDLLLKTLYEDVLLLCETEGNLISNKTKAPQWVEFEKSNKVKLVHNHKKEKGMFKTAIEKIKCAVCPDCGYIETYIENTDKIKKLINKEK